jgi:hypothetical protein
VLVKPFENDFYAGGIPISIVFKNRVLPGANLMIKGISIQIFEQIDGVDYIIDEFIDPSFKFFAPKQVTFLYSEILVSEETTYTNAIFTFNQ